MEFAMLMILPLVAWAFLSFTSWAERQLELDDVDGTRLPSAVRGDN